MSDLKYFRDLYKNPDKYKQHISAEEKEEIEEYNRNKSIKKNEKAEIKLGPTATKYQQAVEMIKTAGLKPEFINNKEEQKIIDSRKEFILKYFSKVLDDVKKYLSQVSYLELQKMESYDSADQYQSVVSSSDSERRRYHNALIEDLKILIRQININFNKDFPEENRLLEEAKMKDREGITKEKLKELMSQREYVDFPNKQGIFMNLNVAGKDSQAERENIANWAFEMYSDLTTLSEKINNNEK